MDTKWHARYCVRLWKTSDKGRLDREAFVTANGPCQPSSLEVVQQAMSKYGLTFVAKASLEIVSGSGEGMRDVLTGVRR